MSAKITTTKGLKKNNVEIGDDRMIIWFDIDNCLYSKHSGIAEMMKEKIQAYFSKLGLPQAEASKLHHHYYTEYGLAIRGLVKYHHVDPLEYDKACDAALPLETVLKPDLKLREMLKSIDGKKCRIWALTNAYVNHAVRVLDLLGLSDCFEGVVSCDYGVKDFTCKPEANFFNSAILASGQPDVSKHYFVDDSALNIKGAHALGWGHVVLFDEFGGEDVKLGGIEKVEGGGGKGKVSVVSDMMDLKQVWKEVFIQS